MPFHPPAIPPDRRDELADYAYELHAAECKGTRFIAEAITHNRGVRISHVTAGVLVREGRERARENWPTRADVAVDVHTATRFLVEQLYEEREAAKLSTMDIAPHVMRALERLARLHGVDAPTRVAVSDGRPPVTVDPATVAAVREAAEASAREVRELGGRADGEDPTP